MTIATAFFHSVTDAIKSKVNPAKGNTPTGPNAKFIAQMLKDVVAIKKAKAALKALGLKYERDHKGKEYYRSPDEFADDIIYK